MRLLRFSLLSVFLILITASAARAQRPPGDLGVGVQIGDPVGLTLRAYRTDGRALEGLAAWDLSDQALFASGYLLYERPLQIVENSEPADLFFGPGAYFSVHDDFDLGVSGRVGLSYFVAPFELFVQVSPRFNLLPNTDFGFGGGFGARYYL